MKYNNQHRAINNGGRSRAGLSLLLFGFLIVLGQTSSLAFNDPTNFDLSAYTVFSQDSEDRNHQGHLEFEVDEQEVSKENSDVEDKTENRVLPFLFSSTIISNLCRLENSGINHQFSRLLVQKYNRHQISLVVLYHSWKGFIG